MVLLSPAILRLLIRGCSGIQTPSSGLHFLGLPLLPEPPTTSKVVRLAVQLQQLQAHQPIFWATPRQTPCIRYSAALLKLFCGI